MGAMDQLRHHTCLVCFRRGVRPCLTVFCIEAVVYAVAAFALLPNNWGSQLGSLDAPWLVEPRGSRDLAEGAIMSLAALAGMLCHTEAFERSQSCSVRYGLGVWLPGHGLLMLAVSGLRGFSFAGFVVDTCGSIGGYGIGLWLVMTVGGWIRRP